MANKMTELLRRTRANGIDSGLYSMELVSLIAADNVLKDYIEDGKMPAVLHELEMEMQRVWREIVDGSEGKQREAMEAADLLLGHAERIRRERRMDR